MSDKCRLNYYKNEPRACISKFGMLINSVRYKMNTLWSTNFIQAFLEAIKLQCVAVFHIGDPRSRSKNF